MSIFVFSSKNSEIKLNIQMSGPICFKCQRNIPSGTPIASYEDRIYHTSCLNCAICKKSVGGQKFLKDENQNLICALCDSKYGPKCTKCNKNFNPGQPYKKLDENLFYHYDCFSCFGPCKQPIAAEFYDLDHGRFLCTDCYNKYGVKNNYDDQSSSKIIEAVMSTKPPEKSKDFDNPDKDLNVLSAAFISKLNTNDSMNNQNQNTRKESTNTNSIELDYSKKILKCEKCGLVIQGSYSVFNEKNFHTKCFICSKCQEEFKNRQFYKIDGEPVCANCHEKNLLAKSSKCKKCQQPIIDTVLTFMNEEYHENCLTCVSCNCKLMGISIYTDKQKMPYCITCFTKKEAKKCNKCLKSIAPNQSNIIFEEKPYHKECFICDTCERQISADETFYKSSNDLICCENCANK